MARVVMVVDQTPAGYRWQLWTVMPDGGNVLQGFGLEETENVARAKAICRAKVVGEAVKSFTDHYK